MSALKNTFCCDAFLALIHLGKVNSNAGLKTEDTDIRQGKLGVTSEGKVRTRLYHAHIYCIVGYKWRRCPCCRAIRNKSLIPFYCKEEPDSIWSKPLVQSLSVTPLVGFYACDSWVSKDACCLIFFLVANLQFNCTRGGSWQWQHVIWSGENHLLRPSNSKLRQKRKNGKLRYTEFEAYFPHHVGVCNSFISKLMLSHDQVSHILKEMKPNSDSISEIWND